MVDLWESVVFEAVSWFLGLCMHHCCFGLVKVESEFEVWVKGCVVLIWLRWLSVFGLCLNCEASDCACMLGTVDRYFVLISHSGSGMSGDWAIVVNSEFVIWPLVVFYSFAGW